MNMTEGFEFVILCNVQGLAYQENANILGWKTSKVSIMIHQVCLVVVGDESNHVVLSDITKKGIKMKQLSILITGASSGIGRECALFFEKEGHVVFAGIRQPEAGEALQKEASDPTRLKPIVLDVEDEASLKQAFRTVQDEVGSAGLDGLVNNAGLVVAGPLEYLPIEQLQKQFEVNVTGQIRVTQAFLPLIRKGKGRIVNMGSIAGKSTLPFTGPYNASKHAFEALTDALRMELYPWGIHVAIIEPGVISTPIWQKSIQSSDEVIEQFSAEANDRYAHQLDFVRQYALKAGKRGSSPEKLIQAIAHALTAKRPKTRYVVGFDAKLRLLLERMPDRWKDWIVHRAFQKTRKDS